MQAGYEFMVNTYTSSTQNQPSVAADADGDFVVIWQSDGQDGSGYGIYGQRYNSAGSTVGSEFRVNTYTTANQVAPVVSMAADGDFVVVWQSEDKLPHLLVRIVRHRTRVEHKHIRPFIGLHTGKTRIAEISRNGGGFRKVELATQGVKGDFGNVMHRAANLGILNCFSVAKSEE